MRRNRLELSLRSSKLVTGTQQPLSPAQYDQFMVGKRNPSIRRIFHIQVLHLVISRPILWVISDPTTRGVQ